VIFDVDGVLVDSARAHFSSWRALARESGFELGEAEFATTFGQTSRDILRRFFPAADLTEARIRALDARKEALYRNLVRGRIPVMPGARELVDALRGAGFRLAVGSSGPPENVALALEGLGRPEAFDAVVTGRDVHRGKPDPEVFQIAAQRLGIAADRCAVVEDAPAGIEAARSAGMLAIALVSSGRSEEELRPAGPDHVLTRLDRLDPEHLRRWLAEQRTRRSSDAAPRAPASDRPGDPPR
jgi:beta-phosphoglucomutase